jgi:hypothetical protein
MLWIPSRPEIVSNGCNATDTASTSPIFNQPKGNLMTQAINPTPGRIVWFWPQDNENIPAMNGQPLAAIVAGVHSDSRVNLHVIDAYGHYHARNNVTLVQPDTDKPNSISYATWMPYQIGQAAKTEAVQAAADTQTVVTTTDSIYASSETAAPTASAAPTETAEAAAPTATAEADATAVATSVTADTTEQATQAQATVTTEAQPTV